MKSRNTFVLFLYHKENVSYRYARELVITSSNIFLSVLKSRSFIYIIIVGQNDIYNNCDRICKNPIQLCKPKFTV